MNYPQLSNHMVQYVLFVSDVIAGLGYLQEKA